MKKFKEAVAEMNLNAASTTGGKPKKTFSRSDYDKMAQALLNDTDHSITTVSVKNGEMVSKDVYPSREFRDAVRKVLIDYGVDKQEAESIMTGDGYKFGNVSGLYPFVSASITEYCDAGKKFDFLVEEDFKGSVTIDTVCETTKEYTPIRKKGEKAVPGDAFKVKTSQHRTMKSSSKAPKWLKKKFK